MSGKGLPDMALPDIALPDMSALAGTAESASIVSRRHNWQPRLRCGGGGGGNTDGAVGGGSMVAILEGIIGIVGARPLRKVQSKLLPC
eukprot:SAG11_NODE_825_length_6992_cov_2.298564_10_plen_88_part_00